MMYLGFNQVRSILQWIDKCYAQFTFIKLAEKPF